MENQALAKIDQRQIDRPLTVEDLLQQVNLIQKVMSAVMKDKEHYGTIPGCGDKPALLQPGAQKLLVTFRLAPEYTVTEKSFEKGHREYQVLCTLKSIGSGSFVGQGAGSASTMEAKWRFRTGPKKPTGKPVPKEYWNTRESDPAKALQLIGGKGYGVGKNDAGQWEICEIGERVEHDNPADYYNTVLKMACKRALVSATLTATAASDIFTQDTDEIAENLRAASVEVSTPPPPTKQTESKQQPQAASNPAEESFENAVPADPEPEAPVVHDTRPKVEGIIETVAKTSGTGKGGPWTRYGIKVGGVFYNTFDTKLGQLAEESKDRAVIMFYKKGKIGNDAVEIKVLPF